MLSPRLPITLVAAVLAGACTIVVRPPAQEAPAPTAPPPAPALRVPRGHLPDPGECRIWIPDVPAHAQTSARSRSCRGIGPEAPAGTWILYRPVRDRRVVHVRIVDRTRPGAVVVVRVFDVDGRFLREERPDDAEDPDPPNRPNRPDRREPPADRPRAEPPPDTRRAPPAPASLDIPPGHLPHPGECRLWIPGTPPGRQMGTRSSPCDEIGREAPPRSWILYRPPGDQNLIHVRVIDDRRPGVVVAVRVYQTDNGRFVREEQP